MIDPKLGEARELIEAIKDLIPLLARVSAATPPPEKPVERQGGNSTVNINAGGVGVAISVGCAAFALACLMFAVMLQVDSGRKIERTQDYLNMLWRTYPETREAALKAQEEKRNVKPNRD